MRKDYAVGVASLDAIRISHTTPLGGEVVRSEFIEEVSSASIHLSCLYEVRGCQIELLSVQPQLSGTLLVLGGRRYWRRSWW